MPDERNPTLQSLPVANYSSAIARAVEWLGDRYLLVEPIKAARSRESQGIARRISSSRPVFTDDFAKRRHRLSMRPRVRDELALS
jgi:hypothetical protein